MRVFTAALGLVIVSLISPASFLAQSPQTPSTSVPRLINITGVFRPADGGPSAPVETVTLAIYAEESADTPLWQETQNISVDSDGRYTLLLGATAADGIPLHVFASGEARWLGITWSRPGEVEGTRTQLTSVPYALKASDAETLGGRPASAYLLAPTPGQEGATSFATASMDSITPMAVNPGTPNSLAKYVNGIDLGSSSVYESAGLLGINTSTPRDVIHSQFTNTNGGLTGLAVQNLGNTATSYSGMLFYDQFGALGQFQGFNNVTHEYRINNIARNRRWPVRRVHQLHDRRHFTVEDRCDVGHGSFWTGRHSAEGAGIGLFVSSNGSAGIAAENTNPTGAGAYGRAASGIGVFGSTDAGIAIGGHRE